MLSTNEISTIAQTVGSAIGGLVSEIVSGTLVVAIPFLLGFWRRTAIRSKVKTAVIDALVRGVEKSDEQVSSEDTAFVKRSIKNESVKAGVEDHVDKAVKEVTTKMAEEKIDAQTTKGDGI